MKLFVSTAPVVAYSFAVAVQAGKRQGDSLTPGLFRRLAATSSGRELVRLWYVFDVTVRMMKLAKLRIGDGDVWDCCSVMESGSTPVSSHDTLFLELYAREF